MRYTTAMKQIVLTLAVAAATLAQPLSVNFTANAALTGTTSYAFSGTGTITGLGAATLSGGGALDASLLTGTTIGVIPGSFSMIFSDGAILFGTFNIPTGVLVPQLGGSTTASGSVNIIGGTGRFEGARGVFSPLTGTGTATGATSASIVINGSGTLSVAQYVLPQFVTGDGWYTALYFSNSKNAPVVFDVNFIADNGTPLRVPALNATFTTVSLPAGGSARIEASSTGPLVQGYAAVTLPEGVTGYGVFRQSVAGIADQEAVVPLANAASTSALLTFDDTNYITAVGVVNPSAAGVIVTVTAKSSNGGSLGTATIPLGGKSKTAVALRNLAGLSGIANNRGTVTFTVSSGNVAVLGLRFFGSAFTSIPANER
jgi:hypothetical protein